MPTPKPRLHQWLFLFALVVLSLPACSGPGGGTIGNPLAEQEAIFAEGIQQLEAGNYQAARTSFNQLLDVTDYECRANYGIVLAGVLDTAARIDEIADALALTLGGAPGLQPQQNLDIVPLIRNVLKPFEAFFEGINASLDRVIASGCRVTVPEGMSVEVGNPDSLIYFKARFGYEFDAAAARIGKSIFAAALASIRFVLSQDIEFDLDELAETVSVINQALRGTLELDVHQASQTVTQHTAIYALRSLGAIPERHPNLLALGDAERFAQVDNDLLAAIRAFYHRQNGVDTGLLATLVSEAKVDTNTTDNFLGYVDANSNAVVDNGDSIVIGLRELHMFGIFSQPSVNGGVWLNFNNGLGDIQAITAAIHEIAQTIGDQLAAVDNPNQAKRRLGLSEVNQIIENVLIFNVLLTPLPQAVEFDFGAFFTQPLGLRELFPYWIDDDNNSNTPAAFLIEGESWVTSAAEPYVSFGDTPHFVGSYSFIAAPDSTPLALNNVAIAADGVSPNNLSILVPFPVPYMAYQDPSFRGVLYVNLHKLYGTSGGTNAMLPATQYSANAATASYASFILNEWLYAN